MGTIRDQTQQEIAPVILHRAAQHLLINGNRGGSFDGPEPMQDGTKRGVISTGDADVGCWVVGGDGLTIRTNGALVRNSGVSNANSADIAP